MESESRFCRRPGALDGSMLSLTGATVERRPAALHALVFFLQVFVSESQVKNKDEETGKDSPFLLGRR